MAYQKPAGTQLHLQQPPVVKTEIMFALLAPTKADESLADLQFAYPQQHLQPVKEQRPAVAKHEMPLVRALEQSNSTFPISGL
jgi:hypothetical protein